MYSKEYKIYNFYCKDDNLTMENIFNLLIETSNEESDINKTGFIELYNQGYFWMIYRWNLKLDRQIKSGESIKISTWASGFDKFFAFREFIIEDDRSNIICMASCTFIVVDRITLKPTRINEDISGKYEILEKRNFKNVPKFINKDSLTIANEYKILKKNIDKNGHVNNSVYMGWVEDSLSIENKFINYVDIVYSDEIRDENEVCVLKNESENYFEIKSKKINAKININYNVVDIL